MKVQDSMSSETKGVPHTIYKINFLNDDYVYIGKTNNFRKRIGYHISNCHNTKGQHYKTPLYKHIRELEEKGEFKFDERCFEIIEVVDDCDEEEILYLERAWIEFYKEEKIKMLNVLRPIQTEEEEKETTKIYNKKKYEENKEEICRKAKEKLVNETPEQREKRLECMKKYREKNREELNRKKREKRAKKKAQIEQNNSF